MKIIAEYEAFDMKMPCIHMFPCPPAAQPLCLVWRTWLVLLQWEKQTQGLRRAEPAKEMKHAEILVAIEAVIPNAFEIGLLQSLQFKNISVICGTAGQKN
ncbi:hypothetical protein NXF25_019082, partial [Crotalus adamanteus]